MNECIICGKLFDPKRYNQITCCQECAKQRNLNRVKDNYRKNVNNANRQKLCTVCGKPIDYAAENKRRYAKMHEDCVLKDLLNTVKSGGKLSDKQYNRMMLRALTTKDLIMMIAREKKDAENMRDMW